MICTGEPPGLTAGAGCGACLYCACAQAAVKAVSASAATIVRIVIEPLLWIFTAWQNGGVCLVDSLEKAVEPGDEIVRPVERERHHHRLADDPPPLDEADVAAVLAVVAVVAHHEIVAGRNHLRAERGPLAAHVRRQHHLVRLSGQRFLEDPDLALHRIDRGADRRRPRGLAVDEELLVAHLDAVARHGHDALDQPHAVLGGEEHDDVAALRVAPLRHLDHREGDLKIVGELVHHHAVPFLNRRLHRAGGDVVPVGQRRAERADDQDHHEEDLDLVECFFGVHRRQGTTEDRHSCLSPRKSYAFGCVTGSFGAAGGTTAAVSALGAFSPMRRTLPSSSDICIPDSASNSAGTCAAIAVMSPVILCAPAVLASPVDTTVILSMLASGAASALTISGMPLISLSTTAAWFHSWYASAFTFLARASASPFLKMISASASPCARVDTARPSASAMRRWRSAAASVSMRARSISAPFSTEAISSFS